MDGEMVMIGIILLAPETSTPEVEDLKETTLSRTEIEEMMRESTSNLEVMLILNSLETGTEESQTLITSEVEETLM